METINENTINELKELMDDDFEGLIDSFIDDIEIKTLQIKNFVDKQDHVNLRQKAHSLKGSSRNIGADKMSELCQQLEHFGKEGLIDNVYDVYVKLEKEALNVKNCLKDIKTSLN